MDLQIFGKCKTCIINHTFVHLYCISHVLKHLWWIVSLWKILKELMIIDGRTENEPLCVGMFPDMEADVGMFRLNRLDLGRGWTFWVLMVYYETMKSIYGMATVWMPKKRTLRTWRILLTNHRVQNDHFGHRWNKHQHQHYLPLHCLFSQPGSRMHSIFMDSTHSQCIKKKKNKTLNKQQGKHFP